MASYVSNKRIDARIEKKMPDDNDQAWFVDWIADWQEVTK
jgi:hypothetical protein